nr:uncharacterized protein LOC110283431 [Parasteatoda tepidariorum]XP_042899395.1 uncharacterized protein LOC110283431 [Parasteatoda tepidariorum]XP_042899396.1 uncharacterized protein LOC110283431 [Parasteatoda tepidariorum]
MKMDIRFKIGERKKKNSLVCDSLISIEKGFKAIKKHYETVKHKNNFKLKKDSSQLHLSFCGTSDEDNSNKMPSLQLYSSKEAALRAELIWCMKVVACNMSVETTKDIAHLFKGMFPGAIPEQFSLNPTKASYLITDALAPYFKEMLLTEVQGAFFSIQYDETTNNAGQKELQILIRFWSESTGEVCTKHLESVCMGHATAEDIKKNILKCLDNANLPLCKILMLGSDGPNVNKKVFRLINEEMKLVRNEGLFDVGFCNIHIMHNAFQKGLGELGCDASDLIIGLFNYFQDWPSRWEDFSNIQMKKKVPNLHFLKHVTSRWLTLEPAANRVLQQWDAIVEYFLNYIPSKQSRLMATISYKKILSFLQKKSMRAELNFICTSSSLFTKFTGLFQKEEPLIHVLFDEIKELLLTIMGRVCKTEAVTEFRQEPSLDAFKAENLLKGKDIFFNESLLSCLSSLSQNERDNFTLRARQHYVAAGDYILKKRIVTGNGVLEALGCMQPEKIKNPQSLKDIVKIASLLPIEVNTDHLIDEWKLLQLEDIKQCDGRIDHYWNTLLKDQLKYTNLSKVIKPALTLIHGSADVERGFSRSARIMTEDRASMSIRMLNARLTVSDALKVYKNKPEVVPVTKKFLNLASVAYKSYNYIEQERKKKRGRSKKN